jgi:hypothetical protein
MDLKKVVNDIRITHNLKGKYPVVVYLIDNNGGITRSNKGYFVMTLYKDNLYFHAMSKYLKRYQKERDFMIDLKKFRYYTLEGITNHSMKFSLVAKDYNFLPFGYFYNLIDSKEGELNMNYLCEDLRKLNIKYLDRDENEFRKEMQHEKA